MSETPLPAGPVLGESSSQPFTLPLSKQENESPNQVTYPVDSTAGVRRRLARFLLVLVSLSLIGLAGYFSYRHFQAEYYFRAAEKARQERDFVKARQYLDFCLAVWPQSLRVHFLIARIARQAGFYEEAERRLDLCQQLQGPTPEVQLERSLLQVHQGVFAALTETQLRAYLSDNHPATDHILEALSRGCMRTFRLNNAQVYLDLWLERQPDNFQALLWRGWVHERMYHFTTAKEDYQKAAELAPENEEAQMHLAQLLLLSGELT